MMAGGPHQRESFLTAESQVDRLDRRSGGLPGVEIDPGIIGRIAVKVDRLLQSRKIFWVVCPQNLLFRGWPGPEQWPVRMAFGQVSLRQDQTCRTLRMKIRTKLGG